MTKATSKNSKTLRPGFFNLISQAHKTHKILGITIFVLLGLFAIFRFINLFHGWWYLDENIHMVVGQAISRGELLYRDVFDHRPPLLYLVYAFSYSIFGNAMWPLRLLNTLVQLGLLWYLDKFSREVFGFNKVQRLLSIAIYLFIITFLFEASILHAEPFVEIFITAGFLLILKPLLSLSKQPYRILNWSMAFGFLLWSMGSLVKVQGFVGILGFIFIWVAIYWKQAKFDGKFGFLTRQLTFGGLVFILPWVILFSYYLIIGEVNSLVFALFEFNSQYVSEGTQLLFFGVDFSSLVSPLQGRLIFYLVSVGIIVWAYLKGKVSRSFLIWSLWLGSSFVAGMLSERNYPHYLLHSLLPMSMAFAFVYGWIKEPKFEWSQKAAFTLLLILIFHNRLAYLYGNRQANLDPGNNLGASYAFVEEVINKNAGQDAIPFTNSFGFKDSSVIDYIKSNTSSDDRIYVIANQTELYLLSERLPANKFIVDFHYSPKDEADEIYADIVSKETELVIVDVSKDYNAYIFERRLEQDYVKTESFGLLEVWEKRR
jgi:hypothetical protein